MDQMRVLTKKVFRYVVFIITLLNQILDMSKQVSRVDSTVSGMDKKNSNILEAIDKVHFEKGSQI